MSEARPCQFSQAYVVAHEIGHHVQNQLGILTKVQEAQSGMDKAEANALQVRVELQADCLAGVWANRAQAKWQFIEPGDVEAALQTASAIGDDRLQRRTQGYVVPDAFTHGTSAQRIRWFLAGLKSGLSPVATRFAPNNFEKPLYREPPRKRQMLTAEPENAGGRPKSGNNIQAVNAPLLNYRLAQTCASIAEFAAAEAKNAEMNDSCLLTTGQKSLAICGEPKRETFLPPRIVTKTQADSGGSTDHTQTEGFHDYRSLGYGRLSGRARDLGAGGTTRWRRQI